MSTTDRYGGPNRLLRSLSNADYALLEPHFEPVTLDLRHVLAASNEPIQHVYFLDSGMGSVVANAADGTRLEVGIFGRDGMSGTPLLLGGDRTPHEIFIQIAGAGRRISAEDFEAVLAESLSLRISLLKFVQVFEVQTAYTAVANGSYTIDERLARWLLMCHDRTDGEELALTHDFLAIMLGVRRSGVTAATHVLEGEGMIRARRGLITILDRLKLEQTASGSYGVPEAEYRRLIGPM